jgi:Na+-transporting NADH:ubiquinone oxidoreductase subunit D
MSTTAEVAAKPAEALFSKRRKKLITDPLDDSNPVTVQVLGICSSLAVTAKLEPTLVMSISVIIVVVMSNFAISLIRNIIPGRIRIIIQLAVVAAMVILVDQVLKAYVFEVSKIVGVYVGLIITNCIVMGRLEAYAMGNKPYDSILDGIGNGLGYAMIIMIIAFFRELLGSGSLFGVKIIEMAGIPFQANGLMTNPVGAFMLLGIIIWVQRWRNKYVESH